MNACMLQVAHPTAGIVAINSLSAKVGGGLSATTTTQATKVDGALDGTNFFNSMRNFIQRNVDASRNIPSLKLGWCTNVDECFHFLRVLNINIPN